MNRACGLQSRPALRRGVTLTEMLVTMTVASVAMSTAVTLVHRALRLEAVSRRVLERERAALAASPLARERLPGARLTAARGDSPLGERVVLALTWDAAGRRGGRPATGARTDPRCGRRPNAPRHVRNS